MKKGKQRKLAMNRIQSNKPNSQMLKYRFLQQNHNHNKMNLRNQIQNKEMSQNLQSIAIVKAAVGFGAGKMMQN
jgi:hypothetical protein